MKKLKLLIGILLLGVNSYGQNFSLISEKENEITFEHQLDYISPDDYILNGSIYQDYSVAYKILMTEKGAPELPKFSESIIVPNVGALELEILHDGYTEYQNVDVLPSKGSLKRNVDPSSVPFTFGSAYNEDAFYPGDLATMREPFILRETRGASVEFHPFQYNPVTRTLRVYNNLRAVVKIDSKEVGINELTSENLKSGVFNDVYKNFYLNPSSTIEKYTPVGEEGQMLIISDDAFINTMQPLVDWRIQSGIKTTIVDMATIGTTDTELKAYVADFYANNPDLMFILLVGDHQSVPSHTYGMSGGEQLWSDSYYGQLAGGSNDYYPEVFVGRFSAATTAHATTMVNRTIEYEKDPAAGNWMTNAIGLASNEGSGIGDDGEADWQHARNMRTKLLAYGYNTVYEFYDGSHGGDDASGNVTSSMVVAAVDAGVGLFNYTGHGDQNTCITGNYGSTQVNAGTNNGMYPFVISVACNNGTFTSGTCLSESWLRATNSGTPSGAISACGSSILMAWAEPMQTQDEMTEIITEAYPSNYKVTLGGLFYNGQMSMLEQYGNTSAREVMQTWVMFGDPATMYRNKETMYMSVDHPGWVPITCTSMTVTCDVEDALVTLVHDGVILGSEKVVGGSASFNFTLPNNSPIIVTATKQNYRPYSGFAVVGDGPLGINNSAFDLVNVYPNPATDFFVVEWDNQGETTLTLTDLSGMIVNQSTVNTSGKTTQNIPTANLAAGVYVLSMQNEFGSRTVKIVID